LGDKGRNACGGRKTGNARFSKLIKCTRGKRGEERRRQYSRRTGK